jgi:pimeloyl-ACP methyl ester carboxylesterase
MIQVGDISLHVEDHGSGRPVLLLHGWPDSAHLWRNQIPFLVNNGFHAIAPDLRGFGRSDRPEGVPAYSLQNVVGDVVGILDGLGIGAASSANTGEPPWPGYWLQCIRVAFTSS